MVLRLIMRNRQDGADSWCYRGAFLYRERLVSCMKGRGGISSRAEPGERKKHVVQRWKRFSCISGGGGAGGDELRCFRRSCAGCVCVGGGGLVGCADRTPREKQLLLF